MKIILNGDDFGYNQAVNESIANLISSRRITSTTMMANAPGLRDAARQISRRWDCSIGVHLNLTEFEPLTPRGERGILSACLDDQGQFRDEKHLRSIKITPSLRESFFTEWRLQVEAILKLDVRVSHFDSHNHIHTIPGLFPVLKRLQKHFGIRKVRTTWNIFDRNISNVLVLKKSIWQMALRHYYKTTTTSVFTSFATFLTVANSKLLSVDSIELMVHPGHEAFSEETLLLDEEWLREIPFPVQLITYDEL